MFRWNRSIAKDQQWCHVFSCLLFIRVDSENDRLENVITCTLKLKINSRKSTCCQNQRVPRSRFLPYLLLAIFLNPARNDGRLEVNISPCVLPDTKAVLFTHCVHLAWPKNHRDLSNPRRVTVALWGIIR